MRQKLKVCGYVLSSAVAFGVYIKMSRYAPLKPGRLWVGLQTALTAREGTSMVQEALLISEQGSENMQ